jgi:histidinol-phosphate/aromatic aminotransferase/cobyric acid decarboxylase-like protein
VVMQINTSRCFHGGALYGIIGDDFNNIEEIESVIDADVLDAWFEPSPNAVDALSSRLPWSLRCSPPVAPRGVERAISAASGIPIENLLCGSGSSSLIFLALRELLTKHSNVLILDPTYGEYTHVIEKVIGCRYDSFQLHSEDNYRVNLDKLVSTLKSTRYDLVIIVNPNNPSGQLIERDDLISAIKQIPLTTTVWIDEAYVDYTGSNQSLGVFAASTPNVIVCKSLSKVLALSGLRVAYLSSNYRLIEDLKRLTPPWSLSLPAQIVLLEALKDRQYYQRCYDLTHKFRDRLSANLTEIGFCPRSSVANFILVDYPIDLPIAEKLLASCAEKKLLLRNLQSMGKTMNSHCFRVAVKDEQTNKRIIEILKQVSKLPRITECSVKNG